MSPGSNGSSHGDDALARAGVLAEEYRDYDQQASLERIARKVLLNTAAAMEDRAHRASSSSSPGRPWWR